MQAEPLEAHTPLKSSPQKDWFSFSVLEDKAGIGGEVIMWLLLTLCLWAKATPLIARLLISEPQLVNIISSGLACKISATVRRAPSIVWRASFSRLWLHQCFFLKIATFSSKPFIFWSSTSITWATESSMRSWRNSMGWGWPLILATASWLPSQLLFLNFPPISTGPGLRPILVPRWIYIPVRKWLKWEMKRGRFTRPRFQRAWARRCIQIACRSG